MMKNRKKKKNGENLFYENLIKTVYFMHRRIEGEISSLQAIGAEMGLLITDLNFVSERNTDL